MNAVINVRRTKIDSFLIIIPTVALHRPQSATSRVDDELIQKSLRALTNTTDPLERLRLLCLTRGASGIVGIGRFVKCFCLE